MKTILILMLALITISAHAQTNEGKAYDLGMEAIKKMDAGNTQEAIKLLKEAQKLAPDDLNYPYEIAYANVLEKNYKESIKILNGLKKHKQVNDRVYQLLGSCYDYIENPEKAIETYEDGLKIFPNSGLLYLERGNMEMQKKEYNNALNYYETGIKVEPGFPSNYYWATRLWLSSTEEVWGMIYGEIFMNLERNTNRTREISKMLFDTYQREIKFESDTSYSVSFSKNATINLSDLSNPDKIKLPFGIGVYEPTLMLSMINEKSIDLDALDRIRTNFVEMYFKNGQNKDYPNVIFDYQKKLMDAGHLEAYNHWVLMQGDEKAFTAWKEENIGKWDNFLAWYGKNPIEINNTNKFHRSQY